MYSLETGNEAGAQVAALPPEALAPYAELRALLAVAPWSGDSLNSQRPDAPVRTHVFGGHSQGLVTYLVVEDQRRVAVLRVHWAG